MSLSRYSIAKRYLHWDGRAGSYAFGHTRRAFSEAPEVGIADMESIEYSPHELRYVITQRGAPQRVAGPICLPFRRSLFPGIMVRPAGLAGVGSVLYRKLPADW